MTQTQIPDRGTEWGDVEIADGIRLAVNEDRIGSCGLDYSLPPDMAGFVVEGADRLIDNHVDESIDVPDTYSTFDEFETVVLQFSAGRNCWGVRRNDMERFVRVATGGGRYRSDDLSVFATDDNRVVIMYGDDVWLFPAQNLRDVPDGYEHTYFNVGGVTLPDEDSDVRDGYERFFKLAEEWFDLRIYDLDGISSNGYYFVAAADEDGTVPRVYMNANHARKLAVIPSDPDQVTTSYTLETKYDEEYHLDWDEAEYQVGDEFRENARIVGYQLRWEDPRVSSRVSMTGKIIAWATYYYLLRRPGSDRVDYDRFEVRDKKVKIAEFEPENEDWSPF